VKKSAALLLIILSLIYFAAEAQSASVGWGGDSTDIPIPGDYDGDAKTDIAVYRASIGAWYVKPSSGASPYGLGWGGDLSDKPVPGDYDGDGKTDIAVYRASSGAWYIKPSSGAASYGVGWGGDPSDKPVPGDYDGDGKIDIAVYRASNGAWYIKPSSGAAPYGVGWGGDPSDKPVPGDYDGDGKTDVAVYQDSTGRWSIIPSSGTPSYVGKGSPQFRAIGGVSMGAYGAMNIGLGRPDFFNTIASLGGPLDMAYMLKFLKVDMLGNYDNPSVYPNRDTLIGMLKDLTISFGNPVYYNPLSTYYPPGITAQNARVPTTLLNFKDGELNPNGSRPVITYEDPAPGDWVEVLLALDSNGNGKRDLGEPILRQLQEPFIDTNGNGMFDPGEPFSDTGLDGVWGTGDYGEGDGELTYNPNHDNFLAEDPLTRANTLPLATLQNLNLYLDAGTQDEYQFNINAENFVQALFDRSLNFRVENGFPENFPRVSHFNEKRVYVRYPGGHVGFNKENIGLSFEQAKQGIEEAIVVANRFTTLFSFVSGHFTGGDFGTNPLELILYPSKMEVAYFTSSSLNRTMKFGIYLPPGYSRSRTNYYPILYLLLGYNMSVDGMANSWMKAVLDGLILTGEMQKTIIVIPDGLNYKNQNGQKGHFFVNQIDQERGDNFKDYFFDLVTFIDTYYKTK
jgi:FG-GAP-like repeat/Putative esterase